MQQFWIYFLESYACKIATTKKAPVLKSNIINRYTNITIFSRQSSQYVIYFTDQNNINEDMYTSQIRKNE
jgi:hypothetical protein